MRAGKARAGERRWRGNSLPMFDPDWRKPKPLTFWQRIARWLNSP